jgi:hypothetical protein
MTSNIDEILYEDIERVIGDVHDVLNRTEQYHLQCEVIASAMIYLKENPESSISDALSAGLSDWDV